MACEDRLGVEVALGRRLAAEGVGLVGHADVQCVTVEVGVHRHRGDAELAARPDHPDGDLAAVCNEDLLEHAGLSSLRRAFTIARALWCLPCGPGVGRSAGSTRSAPPTPMSVTRLATGHPTDSSRWPTTRPPDAVGSTGAGSRRRARTCWPRSCCGPPARASDVHLCAGAVALAGADACSGGRRRRAGAEVAQRPAGWRRQAKLAGVLAEAEFAGTRPQPPSSSASGSTWPGPGPAGAGGTCLDDLGGDGAAGGPRRSSSSDLLGALAPRRAAARRRGRSAQPWPTRCDRRCATLGQEVRVILAGEELTGRPRAIDDAGRLVVETAAGPRAVSAGDVVHLRPRPGQRRKGSGAWANIRRHYAPSRDGRCRFHRVELRPILGRAAPRGPCRRLRRPHLRRQPTQPVRHRGPDRLRPGRHLRPDAAEKALRGEEIDTIVHFAAESHNSLAVLNPGPVLPDQRARDPDHAGGGPAGGRRPVPPRLDLRGLRGPRRSTPTRSSTRTRPTGPARRTTRRRPGPTTRCGPTPRPTGCPSRSPTAPTTTAPTSSPRS